jgi:hypothetical protein
MAIEFELLLPAIDIELTGMRVFANRRCAIVGLGLGETQAPKLGFDFGEAGGGRCLALTCQTKLGARPFDARRQLAIPAREEHFLPPAIFVPKPLVTASLRGLPFERAALLLHFEDDVVDANQVLLRGVQLQLGGAAP